MANKDRENQPVHNNNNVNNKWRWRRAIFWLLFILTVTGISGTWGYDKCQQQRSSQKIADMRTTTVPSENDHEKYDIHLVYVLDESGSMQPDNGNKALLEQFKNYLIADIKGAEDFKEFVLKQKDFSKILFSYLLCSAKTVCDKNCLTDKNRYRVSTFTFGSSLHILSESQPLESLDEIIKKVLSNNHWESSTDLHSSFTELIDQLRNHATYSKQPCIISITIVSDFVHDVESNPEIYLKIASIFRDAQINNTAQIQFNLLKLPTNNPKQEDISNEVLQSIKAEVELHSASKIFVYDDFVSFLEKMDVDIMRERGAPYTKKWLKSIYKPVILADSLRGVHHPLLINPYAKINGPETSDAFIVSLFSDAKNKNSRAEISISLVDKNNTDQVLIGPKKLSIPVNRYELFPVYPNQEFLLENPFCDPLSINSELFLKVDPCDCEYQYLYPLTFSHSEN